MCPPIVSHKRRTVKGPLSQSGYDVVHRNERRLQAFLWLTVLPSGIYWHRVLVGAVDGCSGQRWNLRAIMPKGDWNMAGEVLLQCQTSRQRLAVAKEGQVVYVLGLVRPAEASQALRFPLNFALVLDRSFSMRGANLQAVKAGVSMLVDALTPGDYLSVVSFKGKADVIVPAQPVQDKQAIKAAVDGMRAWGGTKMSEGLRGGLQELSTYMRPDVVSRMVVLTDGRTSGDEAACREVADQARAWGVGIYPLGLGANWDERLLDELGQRSGGMPAEFVQQPTDMLRIFQEQARSAAAVAVRNTSLTLRMPPGVAARRAVRMLPIVDDLSDGVLGSMKVEVALGDLPRDATQAVHRAANRLAPPLPSSSQAPHRSDHRQSAASAPRAAPRPLAASAASGSYCAPPLPPQIGPALERYVTYLLVVAQIPLAYRRCAAPTHPAASHPSSPPAPADRCPRPRRAPGRPPRDRPPRPPTCGHRSAPPSGSPHPGAYMCSVPASRRASPQTSSSHPRRASHPPLP